MSETTNTTQNEKAAKIRRKPERESVLKPTFAVARQATPDRQQSHPPGGGLLQRQCSCGKHTIGGGVCEECQQKGEIASPNALDDLSLSSPPDIQTTRDNTAHFNLSHIPAQTRIIANGQPLQPALTVNAPGDQYEQEADHVADAVMRMPTSTPSSPSTEIDSFAPLTVSRLPAISQIQTSGNNGAFQAPTSVENRINQMQGNGQALPAEDQDFFEERMGYDFSHVRVHTNANAVQASRDIQARAFTVGNNIAFNEGSYQPGTDAGRRLLAHELTHVVQQGSGKVQPKFEENCSVQNSSLGTSTAATIQREDENKLDQLNEMLDSFNVPEDEVITLCGQLSAPEKATVLAGGYRSRMASALNVSEMVQAVNNLGPVLSTKLEWINEAALMTRSIDYEDIDDLVRSADQSERDALKINYWKNFFVSVCTNETMVTALNDLGFDLATKLEWLQAEMTVTSLELDYATLKPWITDPAADKTVLKTNKWRDFFVDVCDNQTMVTALNDLGFDLATKLEWLQAEMTVTSLELDYATIKPWITDPAADKTVLKTNEWRDFFVKVCTNKTMVEALNDLGFDLATKLEWLQAETTVTSWELDYAALKPLITAASQAEKDALKTDTWRDFFDAVCNRDTFVEALNDLGFDPVTKVQWFQLVEIGGTAVDSDKALVIAELTKIPLIALSALKEEGVKVVVCRNSVTEIRTDLKGVRPRGWPAGKTWDTVPGLNDPNSNRVIIAIRNGKVPPAGDGHGAFNLVLHETGHAIGDAVESGGEDDPRFIAAREKDKALLDSYEGQAGHAGVEETYAESFARFYGNDPTDAATYPNLHAYWASNPFESK